MLGSNPHLAGHLAEPGHREIPRDDALTESRVVLVFEVDEQGADFALVCCTGVSVIL